MAWQPIRSILDDQKVLFEYDEARRLIRFRHRKGKEELIDLARFDDCAEALADVVAAELAEEGVALPVDLG